MSEKSLGQIMAEKLAESTSTSVDSVRAQQLEKSAEALAKFRAVEVFFDNAKAFFLANIPTSRDPSKLEIKVMPGVDEPNSRIWEVLQFGNSRASTKHNSLEAESSPYHALWREFAYWARVNELSAYWEYRHDGAGINSWFVLKVKPSSSAKKTVHEFINPNDVRRQHSYCLHVLHSTSLGYLKAVNTLQNLAGHPQAQDTVTALSRLTESVKRVVHNLENE